MTYFEPTPSEMRFRLGVSLTGLLLLTFALSFRGMPADPFHSGFWMAAMAFLVFSACVSGLKLRSLRDD